MQATATVLFLPSWCWRRMNSPRPPFVGKSVADFALFVGNANGKVVLLMLHFPLRLLRKLVVRLAATGEEPATIRGVECNFRFFPVLWIPPCS